MCNCIDFNEVIFPTDFYNGKIYIHTGVNQGLKDLPQCKLDRNTVTPQDFKKGLIFPLFI